MRFHFFKLVLKKKEKNRTPKHKKTKIKHTNNLNSNN